jgi:hypothetical protein
MTDRSKDEDFAVLAKYGEVSTCYTRPRRSSASVNAEGAMWHRKIMQAHESGHPRSHLVC